MCANLQGNIGLASFPTQSLLWVRAQPSALIIIDLSELTAISPKQNIPKLKSHITQRHQNWRFPCVRMPKDIVHGVCSRIEPTRDKWSKPWPMFWKFNQLWHRINPTSRLTIYYLLRKSTIHCGNEHILLTLLAIFYPKRSSSSTRSSTAKI